MGFEVKDITHVTALVGAATGTAGLLISVYNTVIQRRDKRVQINVKVTRGYAMPGGARLIVARAENHGGQLVALDSFSLKTPDGKYVTPRPEGNHYGKSLPSEVSPGTSFSSERFLSRFALPSRKMDTGAKSFFRLCSETS